MLKFRPRIRRRDTDNSIAYVWRCDCNSSKADCPIGPKMTLKIQKHSDGPRTTIRLIGRMQAEHLSTLRALMDGSGQRMMLDLRELALVDLESVRFLASCRKNGVALLRCSPYIKVWIAREEETGKSPWTARWPNRAMRRYSKASSSKLRNIEK
jgi:hypothetical protein